MMEKYEKDLEIYDVWESPNGNIFIKLSTEYSIAIGKYGFHNPNNSNLDLLTSQYVKADSITPVKKIGKLVFN